MKVFDICWKLAITIILGYVVYAQYNRDERLIKDSAYWRDKAFETDTVESSETYSSVIEKLKPYPEQVPPKLVTVYQPYIPQNVLVFRDSLLSIIDSVRKTSTDINPLYLRQFPQASKLLGASFSKDSLKLDLLKINGNITSEFYLVDYNSFKYQYLNSSLSASELKTRESKKSTQRNSIFRYDGTHLNYDRDLLQGNHKVNATIGFDVWKFRVQGYSQYPLHTDQKLEGGIRAGFRLF